MAGYKLNFKQAIIDEIKVKGQSINSVAQKHGIHPRTVHNWLAELCSESEIKALKKANRELKADVAALERLIELMARNFKKKT